MPARRGQLNVPLLTRGWLVCAGGRQSADAALRRDLADRVDVTSEGALSEGVSLTPAYALLSGPGGYPCTRRARDRQAVESF